MVWFSYILFSATLLIWASIGLDLLIEARKSGPPSKAGVLTEAVILMVTVSVKYFYEIVSLTVSVNKK